MKNKLGYLWVGVFMFLFLSAYSQSSKENNELDTINEEISSNSSGTAIISETDMTEDDDQASVPGVLESVKDPFSSAAGYIFGPMRFRIRGYEDRNSIVYINGVPMNNAERGNAFWSNWGGLNDVMRNNESQSNLTMHDYGFGGIGGASNVSTRATLFPKGLKAVYSLSNRSYRQRVMVSYASGVTKKNWSYALSLGRRWANEGYQQGTFYDSYSYFMSVEKKFNSAHSIGLTAFGAPTKRGMAGASTQEVYDLTNNNYYNPYWGYQNGKVRNSRISNNHKLTTILSHWWTINENSSLNTSAAMIYGRSGTTSLNWDNASDPRPDYYRKLPSYMTSPESAKLTADAFASDASISQIDWAFLYNVNANNIKTIYNADNTPNNNVTGNQALYVLEERRYDEQNYSANILYKNSINENLKIYSGGYFNYFVSPQYKVLSDLLGADYWLDNDKFAELDYVDNNVAANDLSNINNVVYEGDEFGYKYDVNIQKYEAWTQGTYNTGKFENYAAVKFTGTSMWRKGYYQKGMFPDNSLGNSKKYSFLDYSTKAGTLFKLSGLHYIKSNVAYLTQAPLYSDIFISPRTRDQAVDKVVSEKVLTADIGYILRTPNLLGTLSVYYTEFNDQTQVISFYHDSYRNFVNYAMTGIDTRHMGIEFGFESKLVGPISLTGMTSLGYYSITSRPTVDTYVDNSSVVLAENETVYSKNFLVAGTPQTVGTLGLKFFKNFYFGGVNANYVGDNYLAFNPLRRTEAALVDLGPEDETWKRIIKQEKVSGGMTFDCFVGKSLKIYGNFFTVSMNVSNILNNKEIISGGYEQLRFDFDGQDPEKYPSKYYYNFGRTFFLNISYRL